MPPESFLWGLCATLVIVVIGTVLDKNEIIDADWWPFIPVGLGLILAYHYPFWAASSLFVGIISVGIVGYFYNKEEVTDWRKTSIDVIKFAAILSLGLVVAAYAISFVLDFLMSGSHDDSYIPCSRISPQGC